MKTGRHISLTVQWWWIALLGAALSVVLLLASSKPPVYRATSTLVVIPPNEASLKSLATTYADMAVRPVVLQRVSEMLGMPMPTEYLAGLVTARPVPDTLLVAIVAEVEDAALARDIANATAQAFLDQQADMATPDQAAPSVRMGQPATTPDRPVSPNPASGILMGVIAALVLGVTVIEALRRIPSRPRAIPRSHLVPVSLSIGGPFPRRPSHRPIRALGFRRDLTLLALAGSSLLVVLIAIGMMNFGPSAFPLQLLRTGSSPDRDTSYGPTDRRDVPVAPFPQTESEGAQFSAPEIAGATNRAVAPTTERAPAADAPGAPMDFAPAMVGSARSLFEDQFDSDQRRWPHDTQGPAWYEDAGYRLQAREAGRFVAVEAPVGQPLKDVVVAGSFRKVGGPPGGAYGLIVRDGGPAPRDGVNQVGDFYVLSVNDRGQYGVFRREGERWIDIVPYTFSDAVRAGTEPNELVVQAVDDRLTLVVNGEEVAVVLGATPKAGNVGVWVGGDLNDVVLTRYEVLAPRSVATASGTPAVGSSQQNLMPGGESLSTPTAQLTPANGSDAALSAEPPTPTATATQTPTPSPTATEISTSAPTATQSPAPTEIPTSTATATPAPTPTAPATPSPTPSPTGMETPTSTPTATQSPAPTETSTSILTATATPSPTPSPTATETPTSTLTATQSPTPTPTVTSTPTSTATQTPTATPTVTATQVPVSSLSLNGSSAYAEAPHAAELSSTNWTFEVWFKDENPSYNHPRARILTKGDISSAEVPFFASIDTNLLYVGLRSGGVARTLTYNLVTDGVTPNAWHHLAATFNGSTRQLSIYVDGTQRAQSVLAAASAGNSLPLIIGRSGTSGNYWRGKLDDIRLWNQVRTATEIQANYQAELGPAPAGLVGNWRFNEASGTTAADTAGGAQNATLFDGASWSTDVATGPPPPPDFTYAANPTSQTMGLNDTVQYTASLTFLGGFISNSTDLWVTALPPGISGIYPFNPVPHEGTYALNLTSSGSATAGTHTFTMGATAENGTSRSQTVAVTIFTQPDFRITAASPNAQSVIAGASANYSFSASPVNGFASPITLSVSGLPFGANASFTPNPVAPDGTSALSITTQSTTSPGTYTLAVHASGRSTSHTVQIALTVTSGAAWNVSLVGSTGDQNNSVLV